MKLAAECDITAQSPPGARLVVRPMRRSDGVALAAAVAALSPRSRHMRFLSPKPALSGREIAALTDLDHERREALVAVERDTGRWAAVARYASFAVGPATADVAITVADAWQGRGVGTALLGRLVELARRRGFVRLRATTLAGNALAVRLLRRHGFEIVGRDLDVLELERPLAPPRPASGRTAPLAERSAAAVAGGLPGNAHAARRSAAT